MFSVAALHRRSGPRLATIRSFYKDPSCSQLILRHERVDGRFKLEFGIRHRYPLGRGWPIRNMIILLTVGAFLSEAGCAIVFQARILLALPYSTLPVLGGRKRSALGSPAVGYYANGVAHVLEWIRGISKMRQQSRVRHSNRYRAIACYKLASKTKPLC